MYGFIFRSRRLDFTPGVPRLMGILNVTPDSFSDGGSYLDPQMAVEHALQMERDGAAIIDIGGESTRPGHVPVPPQEQLRRILPVIAGVREQSAVPVSVDTTHAAVAEAALAAGADIVNDVSCLADPAMPEVLARYSAGCVAMHCRQLAPDEDAVRVVAGELSACIDRAAGQSGLSREHFMVDPGVGFGKSDPQTDQLLQRLGQLHECGCAVLLGISRKSYLGRRFGRPLPADRLDATLAMSFLCRRDCEVMRVHDVPEHRKILSALAGE